MAISRLCVCVFAAGWLVAPTAFSAPLSAASLLPSMREAPWVAPSTAPSAEVPAVVAPGAAASLAFVPSERISATVRADLAQRLAVSNPESAGAIDKALATDEIWRQFEAAVQRQGGSPHNLADVMAAYYLGAWEIIHRRDAGAGGFGAVRQQFVSALASRDAGRSDADKQYQAESLGIRIAAFAATANQRLRKGDEPGFARIQQALHQTVLLQDGIDLKQLQLTPRGLVPG